MKTKLLLLLTILINIVYAQNKLRSSIHEKWEDGSYSKSSAWDYFYDSNNNLSKVVEYSWDGTNWEIFATLKFEYNPSNKLTELIIVGVDRYVLEYDSDGKPTNRIHQNWDNSTNQWKNRGRYDYFYNGNKLTSIHFNDWDGSEFVLFNKHHINYNGNQLLNITTDKKDDLGNWLIGELKTTYQYTGNNITSVHTEFLDDTTWATDKEFTLEYDADGNLKKELNTLTNNSSKTEFFYNNSELMSNYNHPFKDKTGYDFFIGAHYAYDDFSIDLGSALNDKIESYKFYYFDIANNSFKEGYKITYSYTDAISNEELDRKYTIVNQPTTGSIKIHGLTQPTKMEIYNSVGVKVQQGIYQDNIDIKSLKRGIYFLKINDSESYKFIKN
jgi:hypothetical protein